MLQLALAFGLLLSAGTAPGPGMLLPDALRSAAADYDHAQVSADRAALERLLAPDYRLVDGAGAVETKAELIADFTDPAFKLDPYVVEHPIVQTWSDGALLAGEVHLTGSSGGKRFSAHTRFVDVWQKRQGRWQVVFTQVTRFPAQR